MKRHLFAFACLFLLGMGEVMAATQVVPAIIRLEATGSDYEIPVNITNTSDREISYLDTYLSNNQRDENGDWVYINTKVDKSVIKWAKLSDSKLVLKPGERKEIKIIISMNPKMEGDFNLALLIEQDQEKMREKQAKENTSGEKIGVQLTPFMRIAVPVYIRKASKNIEKIQLLTKTKFDPITLSAFTKGVKGIKISQVVENTSRYELVVAATCDVLNAKNKAKLKSEKPRPPRVALLPSERRRIDCFMPGMLPVGDYQIVNRYDMNIRSTKNKGNSVQRKKFSVNAKLAKALSSSFDSGLRLPLMTDKDNITVSYDGSVPTQSIKITNPTAEKMKLEFAYSDKKFKKLVTVTPKKLVLDGGKSEMVKFDFKLPKKEDFAAGIIEIKSKKMKEYQPFQLPVFLHDAAKEFKPQLKVSGFKVATDGKVQHVSMLLKNLSKGMALGMKGRVEVKDFKGGVVDKSDLNFKNNFLMPNSSTIMYYSSSKLGKGGYKLELTIESEDNEPFTQEVVITIK